LQFFTMASNLEVIAPYLPQHEGLLPNWLLFVRLPPFHPRNFQSLPRTYSRAKVSAVSVLNSAQAYLTLTYTAQVYSEDPSLNGSYKKSDESPRRASGHPTSTVTPLSSRLFGTWTVIQSMVRMYAAYYISNPQIYQLAFLTYAVAFVHFISEWFVFRTAKWGAPLAGPVIISTSSLVWMWLQWGYYVQ
jgi:Erg28 like protein